MTKPEPKKRGRPKLELDVKTIEALARIHCTNEEIAAVMGCSKDTIENNFSAIVKRGREEGKSSLRRYMWANAQKGNATMQIWLSKNVLGMRDDAEDTEDFDKDVTFA